MNAVSLTVIGVQPEAWTDLQREFVHHFTLCPTGYSTVERIYSKNFTMLVIVKK
jgi:hypothetical protein